MQFRRRRQAVETRDAPPEARLQHTYENWRKVIALNNEALELLAGIQEDSLYVPPRLDVLGNRVGAVFEKVRGAISALSALEGRPYPRLEAAVRQQRQEVEQYLAQRQGRVMPRLAVRMSEIGLAEAAEVGDKAAALGEARNKVGAPVPDGYVLTTEAYRQFFGLPYWKRIRNAERRWDPDDLEGLGRMSRELTDTVLNAPVPRAVEVALAERAAVLQSHGLGLAVRSSAVGEGGSRTFAGQFNSRINTPAHQVVQAYREVVASRFSERALSYRLATGLAEVDTPMAVLVLPVIRARSAGILYTRDPRDPGSGTLLISATWGLALDIASGVAPSDLFVIFRSRPHRIVEGRVAAKRDRAVATSDGRVVREPLGPAERERPSLSDQDAAGLALWALAIERHTGKPQDIEWAIDEADKIWILQARPLALVDRDTAVRRRVQQEALMAGGRAVFPGRTSGPAFVADEASRLGQTPHGSVVFLRQPTPEIVKVLPRLAGLVAEWGNVTGHGAALLREFKVPSAFEMAGALDRVRNGEAVSLDAGQARVYAGTLWPPAAGPASAVADRYGEAGGDPLTRRLLSLRLLEPSAWNFRPAGCRSAHDVLRFCHEKAIQGMFALNDAALQRGAHRASRLLAPTPVNLHVLDLGGGMEADGPEADVVRPSQIVCRPFQAIWRGMTHPSVDWNRGMRASFSGLASVMAGSLSASMGATRALGEKSYLLVSREYMNLNSRLAYHFTLVDAYVSEVPGQNYISFRFAGGGATRARRNLRACFLDACLSKLGFHADRRGDVVNAWFKKAPARDTESRLDLLGRLMACASQLDMYMTGHDAVRWYVEQFLAGNYSFDTGQAGARQAGPHQADVASGP
ncbi:MAG: PEP/pyruvate-binding domain-containing protein [Acidobacteriota bacterium]